MVWIYVNYGLQFLVCMHIYLCCIACQCSDPIDKLSTTFNISQLLSEQNLQIFFYSLHSSPLKCRHRLDSGGHVEGISAYASVEISLSAVRVQNDILRVEITFDTIIIQILEE
jgi:hypothetical protein